MDLEYLLTEKGIALGQAIALWVDKKIKRVQWTNEQIDNWFGKRSVKEIIQNGTTCFMNPCLDLTLVSSYVLTQNNIKNNLVIEEHLPTKEFNFNRLHFALDFLDETGKYFLNYEQENKAYVCVGEYSGRKDIPQAKIIKISGALIKPDKSLYENLKESLEKLFNGFSTGYSLEKNLQRLKEDNKAENYFRYKKNFGENFIINYLS